MSGRFCLQTRRKLIGNTSDINCDLGIKISPDVGHLKVIGNVSADARPNIGRIFQAPEHKYGSVSASKHLPDNRRAPQVADHISRTSIVRISNGIRQMSHRHQLETKEFKNCCRKLILSFLRESIIKTEFCQSYLCRQKSKIEIILSITGFAMSTTFVITTRFVINLLQKWFFSEITS